MGVNGSRRAPAVQRTVAVLECLARQGAASLTQLVQQLGLPKSSASDVVTTMIADDLVRRRGDTFVLGESLRVLTSGLVGDARLLDRLAKDWPRQPRLGEHTVSAQALIGSRTQCVDVRLGRYLLNHTPRPGSSRVAWDGETGSPILRCFPASTVLRAARTFEGHDPTPGPETLAAWLERSLPGGNEPSRVTDTDDWELSAAVPESNSMHPPLALTLHLPARVRPEEAKDLHRALQHFTPFISDGA